MSNQLLYFAEGRGPDYSQFSEGNWPLAALVRLAWDSGKSSQSTFQSIFERGWQILGDLTQNLTVRDFFDVELTSPTVAKFPYWAAVPPWGSPSLVENFRSLPWKVRRNRIRNGLHISRFSTRKRIMQIDAEFAGPSHATQFYSLLTSISRDGFWSQVNSEDPLTVFQLEHEGFVAWSLNSGTHRSISAITLGLAAVPGQIERVVRKAEVDQWDNVKNGSFTAEDAEAIFEKTLYARQSQLGASLTTRMLERL